MVRSRMGSGKFQWRARVRSGRHTHWQNPSTRNVCQSMFRRREEEPAIHGREPVALLRLRRDRGCAGALSRQLSCSTVWQRPPELCMTSDVNRREFLKIAAGAGASLAIPSPGATVSAKMIGIQVGAVSFVDEGTEKVLDVLQERGGVNTLFLAVFTYGDRKSVV